MARFVMYALVILAIVASILAAEPQGSSPVIFGDRIKRGIPPRFSSPGAVKSIIEDVEGFEPGTRVRRDLPPTGAGFATGIGGGRSRRSPGTPPRPVLGRFGG